MTNINGPSGENRIALLLGAILSNRHRVIVNPAVEKGLYHVTQGGIAVTDQPVLLFTGGMSTCSALIIRDDKTRMLAHVDAETPPSQLAGAITQYFDLSNVGTECFLVPGSGDPPEFATRHSEQLVRRVFAFLSHTDKLQPLPIYESPLQALVIDPDGEIVAFYPLDPSRRTVHSKSRPRPHSPPDP